MRPFVYIAFCILFSGISCTGFTQKQTFDVLTYTQPAGWDRTDNNNSVTFSKHRDNDFTMVTMNKSLAAGAVWKRPLVQVLLAPAQAWKEE